MKLKQPVLRGHPLHAMLSDFPIALIPTALLAAALDRAGVGGARPAADAAARLAAASAAAAVLVGWWDWLLIPGSHPAKRPATIHGLLNSSVLAASIFAAFDRPRRLWALGTVIGALGIAAWLGGDLVYAHGWRVRPAEELEIMDEQLRREGRSDLHEDARRQVDDYERRETFLPAD